MTEWGGLGKVLIGIGVFVAGLGILLVLIDRIPGIGGVFGWFGRLPGDFSVKRDDFSFYFPLGTSLLLSLVLSLVFYFLSWFFRR
jgi:hypothetical protein